MKRLLFLIFALSFMIGVAYSQEEQPKESKPEWELSFRIFTGYFYNPSTIQNDYTNLNSFYLSRTYIDFKVDFKNGMKLRVTPDVNPTTNGWVLRLRHAYLDWKIVKNLLTISGGITKAEWVGYVDDFVGIRYITSMPTDKFGLRTSVDLGVSLIITPIEGTELFVGIFDGNKFSGGSDSLYRAITGGTTNYKYTPVTKELGTRFVVAPIFIATGDKSFKNIVLALHTYNTILSSDMTNASGIELYGIGIGIDYEPIKLFADYSVYTLLRQNISSINGNYFGVLGKLNFGILGIKELSLVGAFYTHEPNVNVSNDESNYYVGGVEWAFNKYLISSINIKIDQRKDYYRDFENNKVSEQTIIYIDNLINF